MGGLRALLCCKDGNPNNDDQDTANRPVKNPGIQNGGQSDQKPSPSTDTKDEAPEGESEKKPQQKPPPRNLWKEAYDSLDRKTQENIPASELPVTDAIEKVIKTTQDKYEEWQKGGLRYHTKSGKEFDIRAASEKIFGYASKAKDVVSTAVSFDPTGHASSAWTIVSFGMSIVQNSLDRRDAVFASSEFLTEHLTYFALIDANYRDKDVGTDSNVDQALVRVYSAMLSFTAEVRKARDENGGDQSLSTLKVAVKEQKEALKEWRELAADLVNQENAKQLLADSDKLLENTKNIETKLLSVEQKTQLEWLSSAQFSVRQDLLHNKRTLNTGLWLLDSQEYNDWLAKSGDLLWLPGISGCGKSVLCSTVIHDLKEICSLNSSKYCAYWYFEFGVDWTKNVDALVRSLTRQLSRPPLPPSVVNLYKQHYIPGSQPDSETVLRLLHDVLSRIPEGSHVYLVLDALDECPNDGDPNARALLLNLLMDLLDQHNDKVHVLATSRPENDICRQLDRFPKVDLEARLAEDVKKFVDVALAKDPLNEWKDGVKSLIRDKLLSFKERRFRWAELQIEELKTYFDENDLKRALDSVPPSLEGTYRRVLDRMKPHNIPKARDMMMLICLSPVPLDVRILVEMARVRGPSDVVTICTTSFVNLVGDKAQMAHFSVQEYLIVTAKESNHHECQFTVTDGHKYLAEKTVDLLLAQTEYLSEERTVEGLPHFLYAAKYWDFHLTSAGGFDNMAPELQAKVNRLFTDSDVYLNWVRGADSDDKHTDNEWSKLLSECETPIHRASLMGLVNTVDTLLLQGADPLEWVKCSHPDFRDVATLDSLGIAARVGNLDVVQSLLDKGLSLEKDCVRKILRHIDYRRAGEPKLVQVLQSLLDQGLLCNGSNNSNQTISEGTISATLGNKVSALEIMNVFLNWSSVCTPITHDHVAYSIEDMPSASLTKLLFEKRNARIPPGVIESLDEGCVLQNTASLRYLVLESPHELPVSNGLVLNFARFEDAKVMKFLVDTQKEHIHVTVELLEMAASNERDGDMFGLLWSLRVPGTPISQRMVINAATNQRYQRENLSLLLHVMEKDLSSDDKATHFINPVLEAAISAGQGVSTLKMLLSIPNLNPAVANEMFPAICHQPEALDMLEMLKRERGIDVPITDRIITFAILNETNGPDVLNYLLKAAQEPVEVKDDFLFAAAENTKMGAEILQMLLPGAPDSAFTDKLFEGLISSGNANALAAVLDQNRREPPIELMLDGLAHLKEMSGDILQVLLERDVVKVDEHLVESLAGNFDCLRTLLSWKPDAPFNPNALVKVMRDTRSMRAVITCPGNSVEFSEDFIRFAISFRELDALEVILIRQESLPIANRIIWLAVEKSSHLDQDDMIWLLSRPSESFSKAFWERTWRDPNFPKKFRVSLLISYLWKTKDKVTADMLEECSYDPESGENYAFDATIQALCESDELSDPPATERAAEIIAERCGKEATQKFLDCTQVSVTENVVRAAERNRQESREEVLELVKGKAS